METGVAIANRSQLAETKAVEDGVSQPRVGERAGRGYHQPKDSEGDDFFVEAMDEHLDDAHAVYETPKAGLEQVVVNGDRSVVRLRIFDRFEANEISNGGHEADKFEEAIDLPSEARTRTPKEEELVVTETIEDLVAPELLDDAKLSADVVDNRMEFISEESVRLEDAGMANNAEADVDKVSVADADGNDRESKLLRNQEEVDGRTLAPLVKPHTENLVELSLEETPVVQENGDVVHVESGAVESSQLNDSNESKQPEDSSTNHITFLKDKVDCPEPVIPAPVEPRKDEGDGPEPAIPAPVEACKDEGDGLEPAIPAPVEACKDEGGGPEPAIPAPVACKDEVDGPKLAISAPVKACKDGGDGPEPAIPAPVACKDEMGGPKLAIPAPVEACKDEGDGPEPTISAPVEACKDEVDGQEIAIPSPVEACKDEGNGSEPAIPAPVEVCKDEVDSAEPVTPAPVESCKNEADSPEFVTSQIPEASISEINEKINAYTAESDETASQDSGPQSVDRSMENYDNPDVEEPEDQKSKDLGEEQKLGGNREPEIQSAVGVSSRNLSSSPTLPASPARPAGLGGAAPLLEPAPRTLQQPRVNGSVPQHQAQLVEDPMNGETEENDETREKLQMIRVKFLRLAYRLGQTPHNVVVAQVLYRLGLAEQLRGRNTSRAGAFSFDRASAMAEQLEAAGQEPLDFSCTIMVLGKTGVGKSATINSIFDEVKFKTDAFQMSTKKVQDVVGTVQGIKVRVIDTPGLLPSWSDQQHNEKILHSVKRFIKKTPPDIVLYLDRLDMQSRDFGDMPLLRTITEIFGPSIWFNAIVVLTHAASAPPDGPNGTASSYEMFVTQRSHVVQQAIRQAAGDMRLMNPVSLVENHSACRTNRAGQRVLPNGQVWKPHLLLLSFASKILAEANTLLKLQDSPPGKPFATRSRVLPLPHLLSSLLQSRPQLKLPEEQFGDDDDTLDEDLDETTDSDEESDYDELPPFKRLTKAQLEKLSKAQKKAYFDELEYREKLFIKKQLKEERKRRKLLKKMAASAKDLPNDYNENTEEESGGAASVPVPMPDLALPTSFDSDNPTHRYRYLDSSNQWLVRPVLETHGWDHDVGYEGINVERLFAVKDKIPLSFSGQVTKDKKESNLQMELASSIKHGEGKATSLGFDTQTVGKDMFYTLRSETRFSNFRHNKMVAGLSVALLGEAFTAGLKLEDKLVVNKRFRLVISGGAMTGRGDVAYGGNLEATLRDKDYPLGRTLSTLGLSIMDWRGDLAIGCNVQSQFPIGRYTNMVARANLNNKGAGQVSIRLNSSEQLQIALIGLVPLFKKLLGYSEQIQLGQ
ncbi:PREDICTED: translocase of chloroplast 120, chloroplastic-like isoform X2 [Nelumbo nucifera]|uniref:Translocase of chloroplast 120, chloroplastic-like isoform X1 n=1 Tax=Nelumbo nucifera TaxID=4432 RepID=A0A1U8ALQ4_NELNU|nr:PREDICTED: translocase of chloroplast 120, chloroplastic-like isoform X1 [Nelumbo nucifera]XP_010263298.1 PREDICTED: translocase of chloroplast 120, chloroplastic-like isoform X2 [Nelumbo nucifera]